MVTVAERHFDVLPMIQHTLILSNVGSSMLELKMKHISGCGIARIRSIATVSLRNQDTNWMYFRPPQKGMRIRDEHSNGKVTVVPVHALTHAFQNRDTSFRNEGRSMERNGSVQC